MPIGIDQVVKEFATWASIAAHAIIYAVTMPCRLMHNPVCNQWVRVACILPMPSSCRIVANYDDILTLGINHASPPRMLVGTHLHTMASV